MSLVQKQLVLAKQNQEKLVRKVLSLQHQYKSQVVRNQIMEDRIGEIVKIKSNQRRDFSTSMTPTDMLREELHMERKAVMEAFQFMKSQECQYMKQYKELSDQLLKEREKQEMEQRRKKVKMLEEWEQQHKEKLAAHWDSRIQEIKLEQALSEQRQSLELSIVLQRISELEKEMHGLEDKIEEKKAEQLDLGQVVIKKIETTKKAVAHPLSLPPIRSSKLVLPPIKKPSQKQQTAHILRLHNSKKDWAQRMEEQKMSEIKELQDQLIRQLRKKSKPQVLKSMSTQGKKDKRQYGNKSFAQNTIISEDQQPFKKDEYDYEFENEETNDKEKSNNMELKIEKQHNTKEISNDDEEYDLDFS